MKIQIGGLSDGIHRYRFQIASARLQLGERFINDVVIDATLDKSGSQMLFTASVQTVARFECDRCVRAFDSPLSAAYTMVYAVEGTDADQLDPAEFQVIPAGLHVIDITEDVRQSIQLAVPLKLLCSENCKGLCPTCGQDLNAGSCSCTQEEVDTRWEGLRRLRAN
ncbi:MAG: DUF177 domain-containing protein [Ignavibacteriae bacterium]|nr:DUF177 domain-containing protein [Ignavibacteriota bacterium]